MDGAEAVHYVASSTSYRTRNDAELWWEVFGMDRRFRLEANPDGAIRALVTHHFLIQLADAGGFKLLERERNERP